jgi:hypothetical protein
VFLSVSLSFSFHLPSTHYSLWRCAVLLPIQSLFIPVGQVGKIINVDWRDSRLVVLPDEMAKMSNITVLSGLWSSCILQANTVNRTVMSMPSCFWTMTSLKRKVDGEFRNSWATALSWGVPWAAAFHAEGG